MKTISSILLLTNLLCQAETPVEIDYGTTNAYVCRPGLTTIMQATNNPDMKLKFGYSIQVLNPTTNAVDVGVGDAGDTTGYVHHRVPERTYPSLADGSTHVVPAWTNHIKVSPTMVTVPPLSESDLIGIRPSDGITIRYDGDANGTNSVTVYVVGPVRQLFGEERIRRAVQTPAQPTTSTNGTANPGAL